MRSGGHGSRPWVRIFPDWSAGKPSNFLRWNRYIKLKTPITLLTLAVFSVAALAADLTGTWEAEFDTQRGLQKYTFTLKQDGENVIGKANVEVNGVKREAELKEGKVEGDTVSFVEPLSIQGNDLSITYTGKISANEIKFTRKLGDLDSTDAVAETRLAGGVQSTDAGGQRDEGVVAGAAVLAAPSRSARTTSGPSRPSRKTSTQHAMASGMASWNWSSTTPRRSAPNAR